MRGGTLRLLRIKLNKLIPNNLFYKEQFLEFTCITGYDRYSRKFNIMKNRSESFFFFFFWSKTGTIQNYVALSAIIKLLSMLILEGGDY